MEVVYSEKDIIFATKLGKAVEYLRKLHKINRKKLAEKIGLSEYQVKRMELGVDYNPSMKIVVISNLSDTFGFTSRKLFKEFVNDFSSKGEEYCLDQEKYDLKKYKPVIQKGYQRKTSEEEKLKKKNEQSEKTKYIVVTVFFIRNLKGITVSEMARHLGISCSYYRKIEKGSIYTLCDNIGRLHLIAEALGLTYEELEGHVQKRIQRIKKSTR